jgi:hypothetical protein
MTLIDIATYVCNLVNKTDDTSKTRCKEFVRQHHENIINSGLWRETLAVEQTTLPFDGRLTQIILDNGGTGYTSTPAVSFTGGGGSGATADCEIGGGAVTKIYIQNPGTEFTSAPTVVFTGGAGSGATATAIADSLADEMICPQQFETILGVSYNQANLLPTQLITQFMINPDSFKADADSAQFSVIDSSGINFNPNYGAIEFMSSDSADNGKKITLVGELSGQELTLQKETVTLASSVETTNSWSTIHSLSKFHWRADKQLPGEPPQRESGGTSQRPGRGKERCTEDPARFPSIRGFVGNSNIDQHPRTRLFRYRRKRAVDCVC